MLKVLNFVILFLLLIMTQSNAKDLKKVSIQLQWLDQFQFAGYYMAKEKGYYTDVGLDVELKKFDFGINVIDEVISKRATFGIGRSSLIVEKSNGIDIKILEAIFQSSPLVLISTKNSNINSIKDFVGKKMMITAKASATVSLQAMITKNNVALSDIKRQKHSFKLEDLINQKTDLMASYVSNEPFLLKEQGIKYKIFDPKDHGFDFYSDILFTSDAEIDKDEHTVLDFQSASIKGWQYAFENIDETVNLIMKKYNPQNKSKEALLFEAMELKKLAYYKLDSVNELGQVSKTKIQRIYDIYNVMGLIKKPFKIDSLIYDKENHEEVILNENEKNYINAKKVITMCVDPHWMPFESLDKNKRHIGMSADYYKEVIKIIKVKTKVIPTTSWSQSLHFVKSRKCDILSLVMKTKEREKYLNFTVPYIKSPLVFATKFDVPFIYNIESILDQKVGIQKGSSFLEIFRKKYPKLNIVEVNNVKDGLEKVYNDEIFAYIGALSTIRFELEKNYYSELKVSGQFDQEFKLSIGVRNDDKILFNILEKTLKHINKEGYHKKSDNELIIKYEKKVNYTLIWQISILFVFILFIVIFFLLKQNKLRKRIEYLNIKLEVKVSNAVEKSRLQDKQIIEQSRMAKMGEMINMIAHQWRQPLNAVSLTAANLKLKCILDKYDKDLFEKELDLIDDYSQHLSKTIDDFRNFFKKNNKKEMVSLDNLISSAIDIVRISLKNNDITMNINMQCGHDIYTYPNELKQVILNLIQNAQDALLENKIKNPCISIESICGMENEMPILTIKDNVGGIPEDIIDNIFDPYFSTKKEKDGTGLGLYMSKTIIEGHCEGRLIASNDEEGAVFTIEFIPVFKRREEDT